MAPLRRLLKFLANTPRQAEQLPTLPQQYRLPMSKLYIQPSGDWFHLIPDQKEPEDKIDGEKVRPVYIASPVALWKHDAAGDLCGMRSVEGKASLSVCMAEKGSFYASLFQVQQLAQRAHVFSEVAGVRIHLFGTPRADLH